MSLVSRNPGKGERVYGYDQNVQGNAIPVNQSKPLPYPKTQNEIDSTVKEIRQLKGRKAELEAKMEANQVKNDISQARKAKIDALKDKALQVKENRKNT